MYDVNIKNTNHLRYVVKRRRCAVEKTSYFSRCKIEWGVEFLCIRVKKQGVGLLHSTTTYFFRDS